MKCKLYLFIDSLLPKENQNYVYEEMTLDSLTSIAEFGVYDTIDNFQVLRPTLDLSIKINKTQLTAFRKIGDSNYSYCLIQWWDENVDYVLSQRWYFVRDILQVAYDTIQLNLHMDVLNSFKLDNNGDFTINPYYMITSKSIIRRLHKDRIKDLTRTLQGDRFRLVIDRFPEGINPILFKQQEETILTGDYQSWYLVYMNANTPASSSDTAPHYINPVRMMVCSDRGYSLNIQQQQATTKRISATDTSIPKITNQEEVIFISYPMCDSTHSIQVGASSYSLSSLGGATYQMILLRRQTNSSQTFKVYGVKMNTSRVVTASDSLGEVAYVDITGVQYGYYIGVLIFNPVLFTYMYDKYASYGKPFYIGSGIVATSVTELGGQIDSLDRTDPKLIKICCLPYCPYDFLDGVNSIPAIPEGFVWNNDFHCLEISSTQGLSLQRELLCEFVVFQQYSYRTSHNDYSTTLVNRQNVFESKIYNSEFSYRKFVYDSFTKIFKSELYDDTAETNRTMTYTISPNISSHFLLQFNDYVTTKGEEDYDNILLVDRDSELPLFNNAYLNYLRTGYKFDLENKDRNNTSRAIGIALTSIGSIVSFISSGVTGGIGVASGISLATATASQIVGAVNSAKQSDEAIQNKLVQTANQSTSVSSTSDFSLMKEYTQNKGKLETWECSDIMKQAILDLFYFYGYATYQYAPNTPEDLYTLLHTRQLFNFIQADVELQNPSMFDKDIANEIIQKWGEGITFIHKNNFGNNEVKDKWVTPQEQKENIETSQLS